MGPEICGDLNYFSFLITQYVNTFPPCKILKHYLISYDCIQLQAIKKKLNSCLSRWGLLFSWSKNPGSRQYRWEQHHQAPRQDGIRLSSCSTSISVPEPMRWPTPKQTESLKQAGRRHKGQRALPFTAEEVLFLSEARIVPYAMRSHKGNQVRECSSRAQSPAPVGEARSAQRSQSDGCLLWPLSPGFIRPSLMGMFLPSLLGSEHGRRAHEALASSELGGRAPQGPRDRVLTSPLTCRSARKPALLHCSHISGSVI